VRKITVLLFLSFILSGCATYKFQKGAAHYDNGYVVSYDGKVIPEYTVGQGNTVPDLDLARERFNRRRVKVEYYYKKMGEIEARAKELFWDPPAMCVDFIGGILRWPFVAISDYKYNHNRQYRENIDRLDEQREEEEKSRIKDLKAQLKAYVDKDLFEEPSGKGIVVPGPAIVPQTAPVGEEAPAQPVDTEKEQVTTQGSYIEPAKFQPVPVAPKEERSSPAAVEIKPEVPHAIIIAKPKSGFSPLLVSFNAAKSYSKSGRIVSYSWDFGDGDASSKKNPQNTYWSTNYGKRVFTVTLTVKDEKGQTASVSQEIEVFTK